MLCRHEAIGTPLLQHVCVKNNKQQMITTRSTTRSRWQLLRVHSALVASSFFSSTAFFVAADTCSIQNQRQLCRWGGVVQEHGAFAVP